MYRAQPKSNILSNVRFANPKCAKTIYLFMILDYTYTTNRSSMSLLEAVGVTLVGKNFSIAFVLVNDEKENSYV